MQGHMGFSQMEADQVKHSKVNGALREVEQARLAKIAADSGAEHAGSRLSTSVRVGWHKLADGALARLSALRSGMVGPGQQGHESR